MNGRKTNFKASACRWRQLTVKNNSRTALLLVPAVSTPIQAYVTVDALRESADAQEERLSTALITTVAMLRRQ